MLLLLLLLLLLFSSFDYLANLIGFLSKKKFGHLILKLKTFNFFSLCYFLNRIVVRSQKFKNNLTVGEVKSDNNYTSTYFFNSYHMVPLTCAITSHLVDDVALQDMKFVYIEMY